MFFSDPIRDYCFIVGEKYRVSSSIGECFSITFVFDFAPLSVLAVAECVVKVWIWER
jgi:hypothetical protein